LGNESVQEDVWGWLQGPLPAARTRRGVYHASGGCHRHLYVPDEPSCGLGFRMFCSGPEVLCCNPWAAKEAALAPIPGAVPGWPAQVGRWAFRRLLPAAAAV